MREFKDLKIAVAGTGYVGLSIATLLSQHHKVTAVDIIPEKVELINNKKSPIQDEYIEKYLAEKELDLTATLDAKEAYSDVDFVVIAAYAKKKNLKVYAIGGIQKCADRFVDCSPFEVLAYFRNAEEVITDTFHGSIFSVITHRPFTTLIRKSVGNSYGNEEKLSDLLKRLGLTNRMTTRIEDTENINEKAIDYAKVDEQLKAHREVAKEYLRKNLEE